jgi:hypothetical protein
MDILKKQQKKIDAAAERERNLSRAEREFSIREEEWERYVSNFFFFSLSQLLFIYLHICDPSPEIPYFPYETLPFCM